MVHEYDDDEVVAVRKNVGLPHSKHWNHKPEPQCPAYPEVPEAEDSMLEEGEALGRKHRGRGGLPIRLVPGDGASRGGVQM